MSHRPWAMPLAGFVSLPILSIALCICIIGMTGCGDPTPDQDGSGRDTLAADTTTFIKENLPAGRFELPTAHTPVPDLFISLPDGYTIRNLSRLPNDEFFIIRMDDPSLRDSTAVTPGFMRIYVGVNPQAGLRPGQKHTERNVIVASYPLTWKIWSDPIPDGPLYHTAEITSSDFFASLSPELAKAPLNLHIYVAGIDTARVNELMAAAQSLNLTP